MGCFTSCTCCVFGVGTGTLLIEYNKNPKMFRTRKYKPLKVYRPKVRMMTGVLRTK